MASSGSLKDFSKAVNAYYSNSPTLQLTPEVEEALEAYLAKHEKFDDSASEKLHEELQAIHKKHIEGNPARHVTFINITRRLISVIRVPDRVFHWWDVLRIPVNENVQERGLMAESAAGMMDMLMLEDHYDKEDAPEGKTNPFAERLFTVWLEKHSAANAEGDLGGDATERHVREVLIAWGKKKPKDFLLLANRYFVKSEHRPRAARLLCDYIQNQPPHLHLVLQTPLFSNLLRSLQKDTSTTVVSLTLTAVIMLLPHMPSAMIAYLPSLFNIYARLLFWNNENTGAVEAFSDDAEQKSLASSGGWETCTFSEEADDRNVAHLAEYFTMLYGLYPINFTDYIRKPQRYLRHANAENPDSVDVQPTEIRHRSERFRQTHLLHPNFYTLTIDSEKTDTGRWINSEPAELVADCMALRMSSEPVLDDFGTRITQGAPASFLSSSPASEREGMDAALLSGSAPDRSLESWKLALGSGPDSQESSRVSSTIHRQPSPSSLLSPRDSTDGKSRDNGGDSPTLGPHLVISPSQTRLQDMVQSNKVIKSGIHQSLTDEGLLSASLSRTGSQAEFTTGPPLDLSASLATPDPTEQAGIAQLRRHVMLLQNDLNFERYLKQQHMAHIGELRRKQVREAASEAEAQHLINANRNLKNRLDDARKGEMQTRKESEMSRTRAKKWETDFSAKLRTLREESKKTKAEAESLRRELQSSKHEADKLRQIVCEGEVRELNSKQTLQSIEIEATEIERLKSDVERLTIQVRDYQGKEMEREVAITASAEAETRAEILDMKLIARDKELQKARKMFQSQIAALNAKLLEAQQEGSRKKLTQDGNELVEAALAASRAKQAELQKQYTNLMRKYTVLQSQHEDGKLTVGSAHSRTELTFRMDQDDGSTHSISPVTSRTKMHRVLTDSEHHPDIASYNMTPPLDPQASGPLAASASSAAEGSGAGSLASPDLRMYGRGGVQNRIRKEEKGKKKEEDKKEKKPAGIRGIRGYI
ncbi:Hamartin protein-domain-containing protein [Plectosphaerella plurivora]|uniref:Hamartin protein-domain-containing protein n=1 Tax=Plectosphaerella plurivora TaxID=936078 RepID=A0A9P8V1G5_9PEZI|nr:Hamartin protein-domain-containing protein [Plectosphaerella plurivora]